MNKMVLKALRAAAAILILVWFVPAVAEQEVGIDRPGPDYKRVNMPKAEPALCEQACKSETKCLAWTFVRLGWQGPKPSSCSVSLSATP